MQIWGNKIALFTLWRALYSRYSHYQCYLDPFCKLQDTLLYTPFVVLFVLGKLLKVRDQLLHENDVNQVFDGEGFSKRRNEKKNVHLSKICHPDVHTPLKTYEERILLLVDLLTSC